MMMFCWKTTSCPISELQKSLLYSTRGFEMSKSPPWSQCILLRLIRLVIVMLKELGLWEFRDCWFIGVSCILKIFVCWPQNKPHPVLRHTDSVVCIWRGNRIEQTIKNKQQIWWNHTLMHGLRNVHYWCFWYFNVFCTQRLHLFDQKLQ